MIDWIFQDLRGEIKGIWTAIPHNPLHSLFVSHSHQHPFTLSPHMLHKWLPQECRQTFTEYTLCGRHGAVHCGAPHQCGRKGDPFQGPKLGSCLTLRNELSEETHVPSKRFYWEREPGWRAGGSGNSGEQLCHVACSLQFYGDGISFWVVFSQSFWLRVLPGGAHLVQPRWMPERRILGGGQTCGVSFDLSWTLPVGGGLLVPCSLLGPPVVKHLMKMVTMVPGQGRRFQSMGFPWHQGHGF